MKTLQNIWRNWDEFWFSPISNYNICLFRFVFGLTILIMYSIRYIDFDMFYTSNGVMPIDWAIRVLPESRVSMFPFFLKTDSGIRYQGLLHLGLLTGFVLGLYGRSLTWLLAIVNLGLMQRNFTVVYGADLFTNFWLFYLSFVKHNEHFSLLNLIFKNRKKSLVTDVFSTVGLRLIQCHLCLAYAYTGLEKFKGASWWEGSAVWEVIGMDILISKDFSFMKNFPVIVALMTMATVIFEVYFVFAVWNRKIRYPWLVIGAMFHLSTALFMELWFFAFVMITPYLLFLPQVDLWINEFKQRKAWSQA